MAQIRSVEGQVELKCHPDKFFDVWASNAHLISKISPNKIAKVELVDGEWNKWGSREEEMDQLQRIESQIELKCHADKFFEVWASKAHLISKITPNKVAKVELVEGEWDKVGAVYNNGEATLISAKTRVEVLDKENKSLRYSVVEGHILQSYYKSFTTSVQVTPKDEAEGKGCIMKFSFEYEKLNEGVPEPNMHIDLTFDIAKEIDAHLCSA